MSDIYSFFQNEIFNITTELHKEGIIADVIGKESIMIDLIKDEKFGDYTTNVAMIFSKRLSTTPQILAQKIVERLKQSWFVETVSVAGPGFINWSVKAELLYLFLKDILVLGQNYGTSKIGEGKSVNVEYVSANPTGPIHAGHARGAVIGDAIASILKKVGYSVTREYYVNDYGKQVEILAHSLYFRYLEALGKQEGELLPGYYPGDYLKDIAKLIIEKDGDKWVDADYLSSFKQIAITHLMALIKEDLNLLGVVHDVFTYESELVGNSAVHDVISVLSNKGLIYKGILEQPKGKVLEDWEPKEQTLFRSTDFGDDIDRPLLKSDGSWTYFASDIAYHRNKILRNFDILIDVFGADHIGYVERMKAAVKAMNKDVEFKIILTQLVKFIEKGEELKMSKRSGTFVTAKDIVNAVGKDVIRFIMLTRKSDVGLDFDFKKVTEQSAENPIFYVQYASARAASVARQFLILFAQDYSIEKINFSHISSIEEKRLIKILLDFTRQLSLAASLMEPHRIAFYLSDLAAVFHSLWSAGKSNKKLRFISEDNSEISLAKCGLVKCVSIIISVGLDLLGIKAVEEL